MDKLESLLAQFPRITSLVIFRGKDDEDQYGLLVHVDHEAAHRHFGTTIEQCAKKAIRHQATQK